MGGREGDIRKAKTVDTEQKPRYANAQEESLVRRASNSRDKPGSRRQTWSLRKQKGYNHGELRDTR